MITSFPPFKLFSLIRMTWPILHLASGLSGYFVVSLLEMDPRQNSPVASARRFPFSFPSLFTPHLPVTDSVSGAAFNWAVEVQTLLHKPRLLNHETSEPPLFYERMLLADVSVASSWNLLIFLPHQAELLFTQGFAS